MSGGPKIPELGQRDRFVRRAVSEGRVLTLADEERASVPSQKTIGRTVQLFWSTEIEAKRWAEALAGNQELQEIPLATFAADILPGLAKAKGLAGTDWISEPIEAEVDPRDLLIRMQAEAMPGYATALILSGEAYTIAGASGPKLVPSPRGDGVEAIELFTSRVEAERQLRRAGGRTVAAHPVATLMASTLPWAVSQRHGLLVEPIAGAGFVEVRAADVLKLLQNTYPGPIGFENGDASGKEKQRRS